MRRYMDLIAEFEEVSKAAFIDWEKLKNKTMFVTGATGLIGQTLIRALLYVSEKKSLNIKILALVRNIEKAEGLFKTEQGNTSALFFVEGTIEELPEIRQDIDYIIHGAGPTASGYFVSHPVETIKTFVNGTMNVLELAHLKKVDSLVFLSTMEVYGYPEKGHAVKENEIGAFLPDHARNSYPISKIQCENLCCAYAKEYGVPARILRLTQTFGPGVSYHDGRVFAQFARSAIEKKNIILKTKGLTERSYLYTMDAVTAILTVLLKGEAGQIYTAANKNTYCSIYEMAKLVAEEYGVEVVIEEEDVTALGYANTLYMNLDTGKLETLGWSAGTELIDMYKKMMYDYER